MTGRGAVTGRAVAAARAAATGRGAGRRHIVAAAALLAAALAVVTGVLAAPGDLDRLAIQVGVVGWLLLAGAVLWKPLLLAPAMVGVAVPVAIAAVDTGRSTAAVVLAATLLVVTGELAGWSYDRRSVVPEAGAVVTWRLTSLAVVAGGAAVVSAGVLAVGELPAPGGALPVVAGTIAALAVVALAALRRW